MSKKYYAVKNGRKIGIFQTWHECKEQTEGFSNAKFSSFKTLEEAEYYLHNDSPEISDIEQSSSLTNEKIDEILNTSNDTTANAFVDGSRNEDVTKYSYGVLIIYNSDNGKIRIPLYKSMIDPEGLSLHQFAGEIKATMTAITWAIDQNFKSINIFYDYDGIEKFATGVYKKATNNVSKNYIKFIEDSKSKIQITFHKVKAHSGITFNEEADTLAKRALHESGFRTYKDGSFLVYGLRKEDWIDVVKNQNSLLEVNKIIIDEQHIKDDVIRLIIKYDRTIVSIQIYNNSKSYIQGKKSELLERLILDSTAYLKSPKDLHEHLNRYHALQIEDDQLYTLAELKLPNLRFDTLEPKIRLVYECSLYNYLITSNMPEYTSLVTPVFRISEFYLHMILGNRLGNNTVSSNGNNNFSYFSKSDDVYYYNGSHNSCNQAQIDILNDLYNFYNKTRHIFSHWNSHDVDSNIVSSMSEARDILDNAFIIFDKCHSLFYT